MSQPGLRRIAGAPNGMYGFQDGFTRDSRFNAPRDIVLSADQTMLYVADYGNAAIRVVDVDTGYTSTLVYLGGRPKHLSLSPDGNKLLVTADATYQAANIIVEITSITDGTTEIFDSTAGILGSIAYSPEDDGTAIVRVNNSQAATGWHTLYLTGANRGTLQEPPLLPDPPFCDPPDNTIPVTVVRARDGDYAGDAAVGYVGPLVVAYQTMVEGTGAGGLTAFDPWPPATPTFPGPYTTCGPADEPAAVVVPFTDDTFPGRFPLQLVQGPDNGALPTVLGPLWVATEGIVQRVTFDATDETNPFAVDFDMSSGITGRPVGGIAYSSTDDRLFFSTTGTFGNFNYPGETNGTYHNQIIELTQVSDPPVFSGGSASMPIRSDSAI